MSNPYMPPSSGDPSEAFTLEPASTTGVRNSNWRRLLTTMASVTTIVVLSVVAFALITQALRLEYGSTTLPPRLQAAYAATAHASWIGGIGAVAGVFLNAGGLVFVRKNKLLLPVAILALTVVGMIAIAVLFKPS